MQQNGEKRLRQLISAHYEYSEQFIKEAAEHIKFQFGDFADTTLLFVASYISDKPDAEIDEVYSATIDYIAHSLITNFELHNKNTYKVPAITALWNAIEKQGYFFKMLCGMTGKCEARIAKKPANWHGLNTKQRSEYIFTNFDNELNPKQ